MVIEGLGLRLRPMRDRPADYALLVSWRNQPHVRDWWDPDDPPMTVEQAVRECRPCIAGAEPDRLAIIEAGGVPVGFVQYYPWSAYAGELAAMGLDVPEGAWGLDIHLGDASTLGRGLGSRAVRLLCDHLIESEGARAVALGVDLRNGRARRAYEKAGLVATVEYLDTDTRGGERVRSVLMVRPGPVAAGGLVPAS